MKTGVSQKAIIINKEGKILALHRTGTAPSRPDKWDLPGGDLDFGEDAINGIKREIKEETGLDNLGNLKPFDVESQINPIGDFWVTIAYMAETDSDDILLSYEHDEYKWLTKEEFLKLESADKLRRFIQNI
jgi:8-oxo-dGTP diphosphatase